MSAEYACDFHRDGCMRPGERVIPQPEWNEIWLLCGGHARAYEKTEHWKKRKPDVRKGHRFGRRKGANA